MHHFPWLRNRTTEHRKAGKARNTKENRRSKEFSMVFRILESMEGGVLLWSNLLPAVTKEIDISLIVTAKRF